MNVITTPTEDPVLDSQALRAALTALWETAGDDAAELRRRATPVLRANLDARRAAVIAAFEAGAGGLATANALCHAVDEVISALWDFTTTHVFRARNPTSGERLSLIAVGGYGRGELAPYSDLDLLFLRAWKVTPYGESVIEFMLYVLWDLGFKVGWSSRTVEETLKMCREDQTVQTAVLEARRLTGDVDLYRELRLRYVAETSGPAGKANARAFAAAKLLERDIRHAKTGASRYLVEPNVKEGKGGLRDLNTLFWIARFLHPDHAGAWGALDDLLTEREQKQFQQALDFLWRVRIHLHLTVGRADERLSFDVQPEVAARMGYPDRGKAIGVERFMRRYFWVARQVGALTRVLCAKLEADQTKPSHGLARFFTPGPPRKKLNAPGFIVEGGRLSIEGPHVFESDPVNLLRLFHLADRRDLDLHPDAFAAVTRALRLVTPRLRRSAVAAQVFLEILAHGRQPYKVLSLMNDSGLLGRFIPEFGGIVGRTQFNMYHAYTVDEHTLRAVGIIADIEQGHLKDDHPLSTELFPKLADKEALYLAMLLHDTGKGGEDGQEIGGERAARKACERLGLSRARVDLIAWLVRHHLMLSDFAQKRDVFDPDTVAAFAHIVENPERLRLLLILTVADVRAVGPGVWNGWKGQLMRELYGSVEAVFRGGRDADPATSFRGAQNDAAQESRAVFAAAYPKLATFAADMDDAYFASVGSEEAARHARLCADALMDGAAAEARLAEDREALELVVAAPDRPGLFADLAEGVASLGANIKSARVYTSRNGVALDVFHLQDPAGAAFGLGDAWRGPKILDRMCSAARGGDERPRLDAETRAALMSPRSMAFDLAPTVVFDDATSSSATIVEVSGWDRIGLLAELALALTEAGLSINSAHGYVYGARAIDAFYVIDSETGGLFKDPERRAALHAKLLQTLARPEPPAPKRRLARARASRAQ